MSKKVTQTYFNRFKRDFLFWQKELGLTQYEISFFLGVENPKHSAEIRVHEVGKAADVYLASTLLPADFAGGPEVLAKHECIHLLLHRMRWLGECRFIETSDLQEEGEALVRRLEKVLKQ
jgi:hypothetical protein